MYPGSKGNNQRLKNLRFQRVARGYKKDDIPVLILSGPPGRSPKLD